MLEENDQVTTEGRSETHQIAAYLCFEDAEIPMKRGSAS